MKKITLLLTLAIMASSCVSKKEYAALEANHNKTKDELVATKNTLTKCLIENLNGHPLHLYQPQLFISLYNIR